MERHIQTRVSIARFLLLSSSLPPPLPLFAVSTERCGEVRGNILIWRGTKRTDDVRPHGSFPEWRSLQEGGVGDWIASSYFFMKFTILL